MTKNFIFIGPHAQDRLRQRYGLANLGEMRKWVAETRKVAKLINVCQYNGRRTYATDDVEIVLAENEQSLITVKDLVLERNLRAQLQNAARKEASKLLLSKERAFRKAEIHVAEIQLNMLKARNPKIKAKLQALHQIEHDAKENLLAEIKALRNVADEMGAGVK